MWLVTATADDVPIRVVAYTDGSRFYLPDEQVAAIAAGVVDGFRLERRVAGGWLERRPREEPRTVPERVIDGQSCFAVTGNWYAIDGLLAGPARQSDVRTFGGGSPA